MDSRTTTSANGGVTTDFPTIWQAHDFRLIFGRTRIEFDPTKEESNRLKHKYSLSCAVDVFESALLLQLSVITSEAFTENGDVRHMHLAEYQGRIVLIVTTMRDGETVRIISMRVASDEESAIYRQNPPQPVAP